MSRNQNNAFEKFINSILKTHEGNDKLRATLNSESLSDSVDAFLFESQLSAFFIPSESPQEPEYIAIMDKLQKLKSTLSIYTSIIPNEYNQIETDKHIVNMIITKYSEKNSRLSNEILVYLNQLYREYKDGI